MYYYCAVIKQSLLQYYMCISWHILLEHLNKNNYKLCLGIKSILP